MPGVVNRSDVFMRKFAGGFGFALKQAREVGIAGGHVGQQYFERDAAIHADLLGEIHGAHPADIRQFMHHVLAGNEFADEAI